jgi:hypothetical protein
MAGHAGDAGVSTRQPNKRGSVRISVGEPITIPRPVSPQEATERARQALIETR